MLLYTVKQRKKKNNPPQTELMISLCFIQQHFNKDTAFGLRKDKKKKQVRVERKKSSEKDK